MTKSSTLVGILLTAIGMAAAAAAQPNVLVNGDFESNPPPAFGNNIGHPILPWVLGPGQQANVVKVDGPGGSNYGTLGPESDASAPGAGVAQHYLDISGGRNQFYQSFTPQCSGEVVFGGSFSTRDNQPGRAFMEIREGVGLSGILVGQTNVVSLPGGQSRTDPWTPVNFNVTINALQTYTLVVDMDNNLNFDNGFVTYETACAPPDPCCPPWSSQQLEAMLFYQGSGSIGADYTLQFRPTQPLGEQMQAYVDYVSLRDPAVHRIVIHFRLNDGGADDAPTGGPQVGNSYFIWWDVGGGGVQSGDKDFFKLPLERMKVNRWYRVHTGIYLEGGARFFPESCDNNAIDVRLQVLPTSFAADKSMVFQMRLPGGRIVEKEIEP